MERVWFITGASRGFGRAFTEEAVKRGDKVIATVRRVPHDDIFKHPSVLTVVMDVTKTDEVEKAIKDGIVLAASMSSSITQALASAGLLKKRRTKTCGTFLKRITLAS